MGGVQFEQPRTVLAIPLAEYALEWENRSIVNTEIAPSWTLLRFLAATSMSMLRELHDGAIPLEARRQLRRVWMH